MIHVLIIDDDKLARKGLISIVPWEACGMKVVGEAANGQRALDFLAENRVDLAVVDLAMPVMTGLEFIVECKKRFPFVSYVVLSFHEDFQNVQAALRLGTLDYISKMRLDQQDCTEVFQRVEKLLESERSGTSQPRNQNAPLQIKSGSERPSTESEQARWRLIQQEWLNLRWLYTEEFFDSIQTRTLDYDPPIREMEYLLVRIADTIRHYFPFFEPAPIPALKDIASGLIWLSDLKTELSRAIIHEKGSDGTAACILKAVAYVRNNLSEPMSMKHAAEAVALSRSYFSANFKITVGMTFNTFLRMERIKKAKEILKSERLPAGELAQRVGYEDEKYFLQVFHEYTGKSLKAYVNEDT